MTIIFREKEIELHYGMRLYIIYENIMGEALDYKKLQTYTSLLTLFYSSLVASLQYHKMDSNVTYDEFIDWIDDDTTNKITQFSTWFIKNLTAQSDKVDAEYEKETNETKEKKSSKK